jgi:hypothetical protein
MVKISTEVFRKRKNGKWVKGKQREDEIERVIQRIAWISEELKQRRWVQRRRSFGLIISENRERERKILKGKLRSTGNSKEER